MKFGHEDMMLLRKVADALRGRTEAWLVGGTLRDALLGRPLKDIDVVVAESPETAAGRVADALGGTSFVMDVERGIHRAVSKTLDAHVDISRIRGDIRLDLSGRDFTMNAVSLPLDRLESDVLDPYGGISDIRDRRIRALGEGVLSDDPLRLLRAFRFEATLGFTIEPVTLGWITGRAGSIQDVSAERVRDELYMILGTRRAYETFVRMKDCGLLERVFPELADMRDVPRSGPHVHGLLEHSMRTMYHAGRILDEPAAVFGRHAGEVTSSMGSALEPPLTMRGLTMLSALLHDAGKPSTMKDEGGRLRFIGHDDTGAEILAGTAGRLRMSGRAKDVLVSTARHHMRPLMLSAREKVTGRARFRLIRDAGEAFYSLMVVSLADAYATRERPDTEVTDVEGLVQDLMEYRAESYAPMKAAPLITGRDLITEFGLEPGPVFGRLLDRVEEARADGIVPDRESAIAYVGKCLEKGVD